MAHELAGREDELGLIRSWLTRPGTGAFVLAGEAGIGKTTLWRWTIAEARAAGATVLACSPTEAETRIPYAALADLLSPVLDDVLALLPARQRRALEAALVLGEDGSTHLDERGVAFGTLGALRAAAEKGSLLVAVDDVQWLDASSAMVLAYALRRVTAEKDVRAILALRLAGVGAGAVVESFPPEGRETLAVRPLSLGALHRTIRTALGLALPRPTLVRIHELSGGRPLYALELARAVTQGSREVPGGGLGDLLRARVAQLPASAQHALLVVAASTDTSIATLEAVLGGDAETALEPSAAAGLTTVEDGKVRFTHPLLAAAALAEAAPRDVAAAHRALARSARTIEERAVHLARAADGPDASIASSLDDAVASARARGAPAIAADLAELAATVTPPTDSDARSRRLLDAADAAFVAGDTQRARNGYESVAAGEHALRHRALWRLGVLLDETVGPEEAIGPLRQALQTADDGLAAAVHRSIAQLLLYTGDSHAALDHAGAAVAAAERSGSTIELAYANGVLAFARHSCGDGDWEQALEQALEHERAAQLPDLDLAPSAVAADLYRQTLQIDRAAAAYARMLERAAEQQDARIEVWATYGLTQIALLSGRLGDARRLAEEHLDLAEQTGLMRLPALRCVAQHRVVAGETDEARRVLADVAAESEERGELLNLRATLVIQGQLALSLGDAVTAVEALRRARAIAERQNVSVGVMVLPLADEIEALALIGDAGEATRLAALLEQRAPAWAGPVVARATGLAAAVRGDAEESAAQLRAAVATELPLPLEQARSFLALGRALRRAKRRSEARQALAEARRRFREMGAALWAERAAEELSRVGGRGSDRAALTSTEHRIAALVAEGRSNKETAAALFVSVKTVEVTLTRVYRKLGVRGRAELAARCDELLKP